MVERPRCGLARAGCLRVHLKLIEPSTKLNISTDRARNVALLLKMLRGGYRLTTQSQLVIANSPFGSFGLCFYFALERDPHIFSIWWIKAHVSLWTR